MPNDIVWVDKVINPRSAVLTPIEAMDILRNAKNFMGRTQRLVESKSTRKNDTKMTIGEQKLEYLSFLSMTPEEIEAKEVASMQAELKSIIASKELEKTMIKKGVINANGLPRLNPSLKSTVKGTNTAKGPRKSSKVVVLNDTDIKKSGSSSNKEADEDIIAIVSSDSDEAEETHAPESKKRRIVISDDEDINDQEFTKNVTSEMLYTEPGPSNPSTDVLSKANSSEAFLKAYKDTLRIPRTSPVITFEADIKGKVHVIACDAMVNQALHNSQVPTNVMFTDEAITQIFCKPTNATIDVEANLRAFLLGNETVMPGSMTFDGTVNQLILRRSPGRPCHKLLRDKEFCQALSQRPKLDFEPPPFSQPKISDDDECEDPLSLLKNSLNAMFSPEELEVYQFQTANEQQNSLWLRQKQRIQHPIVKLPAIPQLKIESFKIDSISLAKDNTIEQSHELRGILKYKKIAPYPDNEEAVKRLIPHNTVVHEALKYLENHKMALKSHYEVKKAFEKLGKFPLTFIEKYNIVTTMPKESYFATCMLDDQGIRFSKTTMDELDKECTNLYKLDNDGVTEESQQNSGIGREIKVKFNELVEERFFTK